MNDLTLCGPECDQRHGITEPHNANLLVGEEAPLYAPPQHAAAPAHPSPMTAGDFLMTLNGFDEIAIAGKFNSTLSELRTEGRAIDLGRALAFVDFRRKGHNDPSAHEAALTLTIGEVVAYFTPEPKPATVDPEASDLDAEGNVPSSPPSPTSPTPA